MAFAAFQAVPAAPPRQAAPGQAAPQTGQHTGQPPPDRPPESQGGGMGGMLLPFLFVLPLILLLMWSSRSQQKKQTEALKSLKKGDRVITQSGLVGKLLETGDRYAKLEIAPGVKVEVLKSTLLGKDTGDNAPEKK